MTGYCNVNITLHWRCMETLQGEVKAELGDWGYGGVGGSICCRVQRERKGIQLQAVRNVSLSSPSWSGESYFEDLSVD